MHTVPRSACIYAFDALMEAACWVESGDILRVEMRDALDGQVRPGLKSLDGLDVVNVNPATGPIGVKGAQPGQAVAVDILDISVAPFGYVTFGETPRFFVQGGGTVLFGDSLCLPLQPMIGTIGVAPDQGCVPNSLPGPHGGNMDVRDVCAGATLYLPVWQPGALIAMGDVHSIQADGESSGQGVETEAVATIRVRLVDDRLWDGPVLLLRGSLMTIAAGETVDSAAQRAVAGMAEIMAARSPLTPDESRVLLGLIGHVYIGQMVCGQRTARAALPITAVPWERPLPL